jgi:hypothetical protein
MLGTEYSYYYLQEGLKLQLNMQLSTYLLTYKKTYPDFNPTCLTDVATAAVDLTENIPDIYAKLSLAFQVKLMAEFLNCLDVIGTLGTFC